MTIRARIRPADAAELERYFQNYESDLGLRSAHAALVSLAATGAHLATGGRANTTEAAMVHRVDRPEVRRHRLTYRALAELSPRHREVLWLAHGQPEGAWPKQLRVQLGLVTGVAMVTRELAEAHAAARVGGAAPASSAEWLLRCCGSGAPVVVQVRAGAERLLAGAHDAYRLARDRQEPRGRKAPARAASGRLGAAARWAVATVDAEVP